MKKIIVLLVLTLCLPVVQAEITEFNYTISDATGYEYGIFTLNTESLLVTGAGADQIDARGESYIEVRDTAPLLASFGGIYTLGIDNFSELNYKGGETGNLIIRDDATAIISGGEIATIGSFQESDLTKHITFICDVDSVDFTDSLLTGNWLDGKGSFAIGLIDQLGYDTVYSNINFVPEPATMLMLGLGGILLRKKK